MILDILKKLAGAHSSKLIIKDGDRVFSAELFWQMVISKSNYLRKIIDFNNKEVCIGISNIRSVEMLSDLAAILVAGASFVPYDPRDPQDKINYMLDDADVKFCLDSNKIYCRNSNTQLNNSSLDPADKLLDDKLFKTKPENLAYIIYTSGSTGRPKGVRISHKALWHFVLWWDSLEIQKLSHRIDFSGSLTFDASITTTLLALAYEKFIVICPEHVQKSPSAFLNYLIENRIDTCKTTPSYFRLLLKESLNLPMNIAHKINFILIGEDLNPKDCSSWLEHHPHHIFFNAYGPTEATVFCSIFKLDSNNINNFPHKIPIEKDSRLAKFHIVDGELCIEGPILADGYQKKPEESKLAFVTKPDGSVWYKTGDQVLVLADGSIIFIGRKDQQYKIRGVRVELDEIRHVILNLPDVDDAIILVKKVNDQPELFALVLPTNLNINKAQFRKKVQNYLCGKLSANMLPNYYIIIEFIPYNKSNKIDLHELNKIIDNHKFTSNKMLVSTPLELSLLQIWRSLLKESPIGAESNFFNIGGNSLLALQIIDRINKYLNISLRPDLIFQKPSIRELSQAITEQNLTTNIYHLHNNNNNQAIFFIHPATGIAHIYQLFNNLILSTDLYGISSDHFGESFHVSIESMARSYIKILKKHRPIGPYFLGGYCTGGAVAFEICKQLELSNDQVAGLIMIDSYKPQCLWSDEEREQYNKSQLEIMGIKNDSNFARKIINELNYNMQLVVQYQPTKYLGYCLFFYCNNTSNNFNGWQNYLNLPTTKHLALNATHRGIFTDKQIVQYLASEIDQFVHHSSRRIDESYFKNMRT